MLVYVLIAAVLLAFLLAFLFGISLAVAAGRDDERWGRK